MSTIIFFIVLLFAAILVKHACFDIFMLFDEFIKFSKLKRANYCFLLFSCVFFLLLKLLLFRYDFKT